MSADFVSYVAFCALAGIYLASDERGSEYAPEQPSFLWLSHFPTCLLVLALFTLSLSSKYCRFVAFEYLEPTLTGPMELSHYISKLFIDLPLRRN